MHPNLNPYANFLGDRDPLDVIEQTYVQLTQLAAVLPDEQIAQIELRPPAGRWSAREIVAHLADCEQVFAFRLRQTLAEDNPTLQPFDQTAWSARYAAHDLEAALRLFSAARDWNLQLLWNTTPAERARPVFHPERGAMTLWTIIQTMAGHDINHLQQLERLASPF